MKRNVRTFGQFTKARLNEQEEQSLSGDTKVIMVSVTKDGKIVHLEFTNYNEYEANKSIFQDAVGDDPNDASDSYAISVVDDWSGLDGLHGSDIVSGNLPWGFKIIDVIKSDDHWSRNEE